MRLAPALLLLALAACASVPPGDTPQTCTKRAEDVSAPWGEYLGDPYDCPDGVTCWLRGDRWRCEKPVDCKKCGMPDGSVRCCPE